MPVDSRGMTPTYAKPQASFAGVETETCNRCHVRHLKGSLVKNLCPKCIAHSAKRRAFSNHFKVCVACRIAKDPQKDFARTDNGYYSSYCKECAKAETLRNGQSVYGQHKANFYQRWELR